MKMLEDKSRKKDKSAPKSMGRGKAKRERNRIKNAYRKAKAPRRTVRSTTSCPCGARPTGSLARFLRRHPRLCAKRKGN